MNKVVNVEPVNQYGTNLYNCHDKWIATALQVVRLFVGNHAAALSTYTDIDNSSLLAL